MTRLGMNGKLWYQTDGVSGTAGWVLNDIVRDLTLSMTTEDADDTVRANSGWKSSTPTLKEGEVTFQIRYEPGNAHFTALKNAFMNSTHIGLSVNDSGVDQDSGNGLRADFGVANFSKNEELTGVQTFDVTLKVRHIDTAPVWYEAP